MLMNINVDKHRCTDEVIWKPQWIYNQIEYKNKNKKIKFNIATALERENRYHVCTQLALIMY